MAHHFIVFGLSVHGLNRLVQSNLIRFELLLAIRLSQQLLHLLNDTVHAVDSVSVFLSLLRLDVLANLILDFLDSGCVVEGVLRLTFIVN